MSHVFFLSCIACLASMLFLLAARNPSLISAISTCSRHFAMTEAGSSTSLYSIVYVTVPSKEVGTSLAHNIVKNKLAACVNVIPGLTSVYEWEGKIEEDAELLLMIKTRTEIIPKLSEFVTKEHPNSVPEVISTPIEHGNDKYLDWIGQIVTPISKT